ncbi:MAG: hypothetical protein ACP5I8_12835, partial [Phycisphaerae bacterium]
MVKPKAERGVVTLPVRPGTYRVINYLGAKHITTKAGAAGLKLQLSTGRNTYWRRVETELQEIDNYVADLKGLNMTVKDCAVQRREFLKRVVVASVAATGATLPRPTGRRALGDAVVDPLRKAVVSGSVGSVCPMIGTDGYGRTFPGAMVPFGLVQLSPDTAGQAQPQWWRQGRNVIVYPWEHCSGYFYPDNVIRGFSHTHLSGTGCPALGDVLQMPGTGTVRWNPGGPGWQHDAQGRQIGAGSGWVSRAP